MTKRRIGLVTGGTGFIGSQLVKRLHEKGWDVHIIIRANSDLDKIKYVKKHIHVHVYDGKMQTLLGIMRNVMPETVFHLAAHFLAEHQSKDIDNLIQSNIQFSTQLVEAMVVYKIRNIINTGTSWQHYQNQSYSPVCLYAATKQAFEAILKYYIETNELFSITLKLFDTYGALDKRRKLFRLLDEYAASGLDLAMSGGDQLIDLVYIDDVIDAYLCAADLLVHDSKIKDLQYSVSSSDPKKLKDIVKLYCQITGRNINITWGGLPYRKREVMTPWSSGKVLPGWVPKISLEEGLAKFKI